MATSWLAVCPWYLRLKAVAPEDMRQTVSLGILAAQATGERPALVVRRELWRLARDLGIHAAYQGRWIPGEIPADPDHITGPAKDSAGRCAVCGEAAAYRDPDRGLVCRRHGMTLRGRRERYQRWISSGRRGRRPLSPADPIDGEYVIPRRNSELWRRVREHVTANEWQSMWRWARSRYIPRPDNALESAREALCQSS